MFQAFHKNLNVIFINHGITIELYEILHIIEKLSNKINQQKENNRNLLILLTSTGTKFFYLKIADLKREGGQIIMGSNV